MPGKLGNALDVPDNFTSRLRGQESKNPAALEHLPCRSSELPTALRPQHQQTLAKQAVFSFLQSQLHPAAEVRHDYTEILERSLARENPEVEVSSGR